MSKGLDVPIKDEAGGDLGFSITLGPAGAALPDDPTGSKALADRIVGWSAHQLDGAPHVFSKARALAFLARFPHIAAQLAKAAAPKDDAK